MKGETAVVLTTSSPPPAPTSSSASTNYSELAGLVSTASPPANTGSGNMAGGDSGIDSRATGILSSSSGSGNVPAIRGLVGRPHLRDDDKRPLWNRFNRQVRR